MDAFDNEVLRRLDLLHPHLRRVSSAISRIRHTLPVASAGLAALDLLGSPAFVVDGTGRMLHANAAGDSALRAAAIVRRSAGRLVLASDAGNRAFEQAVRGSCGFPRQGALLRVGVQSTAEAHALRVIPVDTATFGLGGCSPLVALVIVDPPAGRMDADLLRTLYELTDAEIALVQSLARGMRLKDCATSRGIGVATARTQLASVLMKTGADSQASLLSMLLNPYTS